MSELVIRVFTTGGRSRLALKSTDTLATLKQKIQEHCNVPPANQTLQLGDARGRRPLAGADSATLASLGVTSGAEVHLTTTGGAAAEIAGVVLAPKTMTSADLPPEKKDEKKEGAAAAAGQGDGKAPSGSAAEGTTADGKPLYKSFDQFLKQRGFNTGDLALSRSYKPFAKVQGAMNKFPPSATLKLQPYRQVDHLEYMNVPELTNFVNHWRSEVGMVSQRAGIMYGYYREDPHYEQGIRAVMEAIYEPPQVPVADGVQVLEDGFEATVERIAARLGLERIGYVFTHLPRDELLTSSEIMSLGKMALAKLSTKHYSGYPCNKQVVCTISPDAAAGGNPTHKAFMIADMGLGFLRDGILAEPKNPKLMRIRPQSQNETMVQVLQAGNASEEFDVDWMVVRVNDSAPKTVRSLLKYTHFPRENRQRQQQPGDIKAYFSKVPSSEPAYKRYADFHLLLYIANLFDPETALTLCDHIVNKTNPDPSLQDVLTSLG